MAAFVHKMSMPLVTELDADPKNRATLSKLFGSSTPKVIILINMLMPVQQNSFTHLRVLLVLTDGSLSVRIIEPYIWLTNQLKATERNDWHTRRVRVVWICVNEYLCEYVWICVNMCGYVWMNTCVNMCEYVWICVNMCEWIPVWICVNEYLCEYVWICVNMCEWIPVWICVNEYLCEYVWICVNEYLCEYV
jgi:hypothetical protein